jgi:hypothetical protein
MRFKWRNRAAIASAVIAVSLCAAGGAGLWAAQPSDRPTIDASMSQLVSEMRELREAVERSSLVTAQAQLLLGRVQLQEARLATLGRQAQDAREQLAQAERAQGDLEYEFKRFSAVESAQRPGEEQEQYKERLDQLKQQVRQAQVHAQRLRNAEAAASSALAEEQSRWVDFNGRLEALERTLASMLSTRTRQ